MGWRDPHFGHPGKTRFYSDQPFCARYVKILTPNPKLVDGAWVNRDGEIEATFYVPEGRKKNFQVMFEGYAKGMGMTGPVEFL